MPAALETFVFWTLDSGGNGEGAVVLGPPCWPPRHLPGEIGVISPNPSSYLEVFF